MDISESSDSRDSMDISESSDSPTCPKRFFAGYAEPNFIQYFLPKLAAFPSNLYFCVCVNITKTSLKYCVNCFKPSIFKKNIFV